MGVMLKPTAATTVHDWEIYLEYEQDRIKRLYGERI